VKFQEHCEESTRLFGKPFEEVHLWLDEYASTPLGAKHRRRRHHDERVSRVVRLFGEEAAMAAGTSSPTCKRKGGRSKTPSRRMRPITSGWGCSDLQDDAGTRDPTRAARSTLHRV